MSVKLVIGLLGGMGSGKSRVAAEFAKHGAIVVSADELGHEALRQPAIRDALVRRWGREVLGECGELDRGRVGRIVFADGVERKALESVVHPYIGRRIRDEIEAARADPTVRFVVLDAAIMLESGWSEVCDQLIYVHAPRAVRLRRLAQQRGWSAKEVDARERAQVSLTEKASRAGSAIDNSDSPESLSRQVADLLRQWGID
ncbi:MAG TPA: dephospho-CoA kinase [Gemmataceae bacterium]|nr:dephospho-CoA kinase [Gemmataceae bacterium]